MCDSQVPGRLWDYDGLVYIAESNLYLRVAQPTQRPGIERIMGKTVDISEWLLRLQILRLRVVLG